MALTYYKNLNCLNFNLNVALKFAVDLQLFRGDLIYDDNIWSTTLNFISKYAAVFKLKKKLVEITVF